MFSIAFLHFLYFQYVLSVKCMPRLCISIMWSKILLLPKYFYVSCVI
uniref:Uncharacterized protein n=1 Tax=Arundo donax TaxID=35708 RepID=A0A0A9A438_ARUDO